MKTKVILLIIVILAVFSLFIFSSWTNAMVVSEGEISPGLGILSTASPLLIGFFVMVALALLIAISVD